MFEADDVIRKEEHDWQMVYLARREGTQQASVCWQFDSSGWSTAIMTHQLIFFWLLPRTIHVRGVQFGDGTNQQTLVIFRICRDGHGGRQSGSSVAVSLLRGRTRVVATVW